MTRPRRLHIVLLLLALAGIGLFIYLLLRHDIKDITAAVATARWFLIAIVALHALPLLLDAAAWQVLFPKESRPSLLRLFHLRWIGEAISSLLPATQLGGDLIRARLAADNHKSHIKNQKSVTLSLSAATVLVDITASIFAQILFTLTGFFLLATVTGKSGITGPALAGSLVAILAILGFYALQRYGLFRLIAALIAKLARSDSWHTLVQHGQNLDDDIRTTYSRTSAFFQSLLLTMLSWFAGAAEVFIALYALRNAAFSPPSLFHLYLQAVILESVGQGIRSAMFFIPAAIGIQEAGYLGVGTLLGIPPDVALALSLIRRVRELAVGIPGLIAWHLAESRRLLK